MTIIKVLTLTLLFIYLLPLGAFCHQGKDVKSQVHCALCHTVSLQIATSNINTFISVAPDLQVLLPQVEFFYQNPSLETLRRPPAVSV